MASLLVKATCSAVRLLFVVVLACRRLALLQSPWILAAENAAAWNAIYSRMLYMLYGGGQLSMTHYVTCTACSKAALLDHFMLAFVHMSCLQTN